MSCRTQYRTPPGPPAPSIAHVANADRQQQAACQSGTILARFPAWIGSNMRNPSLDGLLFVPEGAGPFPAMVALHGAGGIFPYQAWWARQIANTGVVVLFLDSYCTRGYLCEHSTGDNDKKRGAIMRKWDKVSLKQRVLDAAAGYRFLTAREFIDNKSIGLVGWSWGGTTALFVQRSANRLQLPNGGFKGTIAFYPNLAGIPHVGTDPRGKACQNRSGLASRLLLTVGVGHVRDRGGWGPWRRPILGSTRHSRRTGPVIGQR